MSANKEAIKDGPSVGALTDQAMILVPCRAGRGEWKNAPRRAVMKVPQESALVFQEHLLQPNGGSPPRGARH